MKKKQLMKSLLKEPPISKDCLRNSHLQKIYENISISFYTLRMYRYLNNAPYTIYRIINIIS